MIAKGTWSINGVAPISTIGDVLRPYPALRHEVLANRTSPMEDDDPTGDFSFGIDVENLELALPIMAAFVKAGAGTLLSLNAYIDTEFGKVEAFLCDDRSWAQVYPKTPDGKVVAAAVHARNILDEAIGKLGKEEQ